MPVKKQIAKSVRKTSGQRVTKSYEDGTKMVSFGRAISNFFKKYFQFSGVATRAEYWWIFLFWVVCIVLVILMCIGSIILMNSMDMQINEVLVRNLLSGVFAVLYVFMIVPWYALMSRRLHDAGFSAKILWISVMFTILPVMVPWFATDRYGRFIGLAWMIVMYVLFLFPSKTKDNPYRD